MVVVWSKSVLYSFICVYQLTDMHWQGPKGAQSGRDKPGVVGHLPPTAGVVVVLALSQRACLV